MILVFTLPLVSCVITPSFFRLYKKCHTVSSFCPKIVLGCFFFFEVRLIIEHFVDIVTLVHYHNTIALIRLNQGNSLVLTEIPDSF